MAAYARRELRTAAQRAALLALPTDRLEIGERYSVTPADFDVINRHRTEGNRLGFATFITSEVIAAGSIRSMLEARRKYCGEHTSSYDYVSNSINRVGQ